jgi:hypothetical protein
VKRPSLQLGLIAILLCLFSGAASAKGPGLDHVMLDGPGIGQPVRIDKHFPYLLDDAISTLIYGSETRSHIGRERPQRDDLGPQFQLSYVMAFGEPIEVDFYPYADGGPVAYAIPGQAVVVPVGRSGQRAKFPVHEGWYDYRPALVDLLQKQGLPRANEVGRGARPSVFFGAALVLAFALAYCGSRVRRASSNRAPRHMPERVVPGARTRV